jgi:hypothetical protein
MEKSKTLLLSTGFYSTELGRTLLGSTFFMNSDPEGRDHRIFEIVIRNIKPNYIKKSCMSVRIKASF